MADIAIFKPGQTPQYLKSVNTSDYSSDPDVIVNPDTAAIQSIPVKYWKRNGNAIAEMTQAEKLAVDDSEVTERKNVLPEIIAAQWHEPMLKTNLSSAYIDVYDTPGAVGLPIPIDFRNRKYIAYSIFWNKLGTGVHMVRAVDDADVTNVLFEKTVVNGKNQNGWNDLPIWATGIKHIRLQCKSSLNTDDPVFRGAWIAIK